MKRIATTHARQHFAKSIDAALAEPVVLTSHNRDLVMVLDVDLGRRALAALLTREATGPREPTNDVELLVQAIGDDAAAEILTPFLKAIAAASESEFGDSAVAGPPLVDRDLMHVEGRTR